MSNKTITCPVCKCNQGVTKTRLDNGTTVLCECPLCGKYEIPVMVVAEYEASVPKHRLSAWIRERNERGELVQFNKKAMIENVLSSVPDYNPMEKQLKLLLALEKRSDPPGTEVELNPEKDFPLAYASGPDELNFYWCCLVQRGLIESHGNRDIVTAAGWDYLDKHASDLEEKTQGFVAMSFSDQVKPVWENAIKPAIEEAGYTAYRVDEEPHSDNIIFKIMAEIKNSRFVIADITEQKNGVYFEAGYALGLGLPVIWSVRKDDIDNVHFDTAQYNQIRWQSPAELQEGLYDYICAIIGKSGRATN